MVTVSSDYLHRFRSSRDGTTQFAAGELSLSAWIMIDIAPHMGARIRDAASMVGIRRPTCFAHCSIET